MSMNETTIMEKYALSGGAITQFTIVKFGSDDDHVVAASASTDDMLGVAQLAASGSEEDMRVMMTGISRIKIGGNVTRGALLTSDGNGQGVAAAPATGVNAKLIGRALASGVDGDIIPVLLMPGIMQGA